MAEERTWSSRKYRTAWYLTALATTALLGPYAAGFLVNGACKSLIDGGQWLTFLFGIWGIYFGANVAEKHLVFQSKDSKLEITDKDPLADEEEDK